MCVDLFAVGHPITIPFLHEQIWFDVEYRTIKTEVIVDAFVRNDGDQPIEELRLQLPHFTALDTIEVLSNDSVFTNETAFQNSGYNWIGRFRVQHPRRRMGLELEFGYEGFDDDPQPDDALVLQGSFLPNGFLPAAATNSARYQKAMEDMDRSVMVLHLASALPARETGWLRLRIRSLAWPKDSDIIALRGAWFSDLPTKFMCRATALSPTFLREDLLHQMKDPPNNGWHNDVVAHGWKKDGTLTRVDDHRISIVFPKTVDVAHVSNIPEGAFWAAGPEVLRTDHDRCVLLFGTGSKMNKYRDVLTVAQRICDYCHFLTLDATKRELAPSIELLVSRFGGTLHEAIGALIDQMVECNILEWVDHHTRTVIAASKDKLASAFLDLRERYTFPESHRKFMRAFRELHPFRISFTLCWMALNKEQQRQATLLSKLVARLANNSEEGVALRRACIVSSAECKSFQSKVGIVPVPQVWDFARQLHHQLQQKTSMVVSHLSNPQSRRLIVEAVRKNLDELGNSGLFLFWYIGHALPSKDTERLTLGATVDEVLEWQELVNLFAEYNAIPKIVVLDCCHAGLGLRQAAGLDNCLVWATTGANHSAQSGGFIGDEQAGGKYPNFTLLTSWVLEHHETDTRLTFRDLFSEAQKYAAENRDPPSPIWKSKEELLAVDPKVYRQVNAERMIDDLRMVLGTV